VPTGAEDIGTWLDILQITSVVSVITNAALVCYTMQLTSDYSDVGQLWIFIGFQYTIFVIMAIFAYVVDDCPEEVSVTAGCVLCS
jgi:ABC-type amino acid transport system permease subunit